MNVVIDVPGLFLGKESGRIVARRNRELIGELPLDEIDSILIEGNGISLSSDAIAACAARGITIDFMSSLGDPLATIYSPVFNASVQTRRAQLAAYLDERGVTYARLIVGAKLRNQANLLKYAAKYRHQRQPETYRILRSAAEQLEELARASMAVRGSCVDDVRNTLLSIEGRAGAIYWSAFGALVPDFPGRRHQGATDGVNQALNYGYGILYRTINRALVLAGLDPYGGFIHVDRPGKPSLVLDAVEEFRQSVVDRAVLGLVGRNAAFRGDETGLDRASRRAIADGIEARLNTAERHGGAKRQLRGVIAGQARSLATFLRGERTYRPFVRTW